MADPQAGQKERLVSLDAFRGLTVLLMLLVNNAAMDTATPSQFLHAPWNEGVRLADLVFPWFLFAVGIAIPFSFRSMRKAELTTKRIAIRVTARVAALLAIGMLVESVIQHKMTIGLGVLQLIGLAYGLGCILFALKTPYRIAAVSALLLGYGLSIMFVPVPGYGVPVFDEGKNLIHFVNMEYLLDFKLKGLLSTIPTGALVGIGTFLGDVVLSKQFTFHQLAIRLFATGTAIALVGALWSIWLPMNKPVWTPSYILFAAGLGSVTIAILSALFDSGKLALASRPLQVLGANALLAYVGPILLKVVVLQGIELEYPTGTLNLQQWLLKSLTDPFGQTVGGWTYTISYILIVWVGLAALYRKRWFLRV